LNLKCDHEETRNDLKVEVNGDEAIIKTRSILDSGKNDDDLGQGDSNNNSSTTGNHPTQPSTILSHSTTLVTETSKHVQNLLFFGVKTIVAPVETAKTAINVAGSAGQMVYDSTVGMVLNSKSQTLEGDLTATALHTGFDLSYLRDMTSTVLNPFQLAQIGRGMDISGFPTTPACDTDTDFIKASKSFPPFRDLKTEVYVSKFGDEDSLQKVTFFSLKGVMKIWAEEVNSTSEKITDETSNVTPDKTPDETPDETSAETPSESVFYALTCNYLTFKFTIDSANLELIRHEKLPIDPKLTNVPGISPEDPLLAKHERDLYKSLLNLKLDILKPLTYSEKAKQWTVDNKPNLAVFQSIVMAFECLIHVVGIQARELTLNTKTHNSDLSLYCPLTKSPNKFLKRFIDYAKSLNNACAMGVINELQPKVLENNGEKLFQILSKPLLQLEFYCNYFRERNPELSYKITTEIQLIKNDRDSAEETAMYFDNASKMLNSGYTNSGVNIGLIFPEKLKKNGQRRYIFDSRRVPVQAKSALIGVCTEVVLFDDMIVIFKPRGFLKSSKDSEFYQFNLKTVWLEDNLELSDSLKIIVPEDELTFTFAGGEDAKCIWLKKLSHYSALCFDPEATDENSDTESNENFSNERSTTYLFSKSHKLYPGATYIGSWDGSGQISGQGTLLYPDGSRLLSEFLEGLTHGCGV